MLCNCALASSPSMTNVIQCTVWDNTDVQNAFVYHVLYVSFQAFTLLIHDLGLLHFPVSQAKCEELDREDNQKFKEIFKHWKKDYLKSIQKQKNKHGENDPKRVNNLSSAYRKWASDDLCALLCGL